MSFKKIVVCLVWLIFAGCTSLPSASELPVRTLAKSYQSHILDARKTVIRDAATWARVWQEHTGPSAASEPPPNVDFSVDMVVLVSLGQKKTGGYGQEIIGAKLINGQLVIEVQHWKPENEASLRPELIAPIHMVAVPQSNLQPVFEDFVLR